MSHIRVELTPRQLELEPGSSAAVQVRVTNATDIVDDFSVALVGSPHPGITAAAQRLPLLCDETGTVTLTIHVAGNSAAPPAGPTVVGVRVASATHPDLARVEEIPLTVGATGGTALSLEPQLVRGGSSARLHVVVANQRNVGLNVSFQGHDPERAMRFDFRPPVVAVPAMGSVNAALTVRARRPFSGSDRRTMITVRADGAPEALSATATLVQEPLVSPTLLRVIGAVAALAVVAGAVLGAALLASDGNVQIDTREASSEGLQPGTRRHRDLFPTPAGGDARCDRASDRFGHHADQRCRPRGERDPDR
jgi:hypothetical protein